MVRIEIDSEVIHPEQPDVRAYVVDILDRTADGDVLVKIAYAQPVKIGHRLQRIHQVRWSLLLQPARAVGASFRK